jgi:hypothetical protein
MMAQMLKVQHANLLLQQQSTGRNGTNVVPMLLISASAAASRLLAAVALCCILRPQLVLLMPAAAAGCTLSASVCDCDTAVARCCCCWYGPSPSGETLYSSSCTLQQQTAMGQQQTVSISRLPCLEEHLGFAVYSVLINFAHQTYSLQHSSSGHHLAVVGNWHLLDKQLCLNEMGWLGRTKCQQCQASHPGPAITQPPFSTVLSVRTVLTIG